MTLGLHDQDKRHKRRLWSVLARLGLLALLLGATAVFAYQIGVEQVKVRSERLEDRIADLETTNARLEQNAVRLEAAVRTAERRLGMVREELLSEMEQGPQIPEALSALVADRLSAGIPQDRLAAILRHVHVERDCSEPNTRRFIMPLSAAGGQSGSVAFAEGRFTVTGQGAPARSATGAAQAWFDPEQPVTLRFIDRDGATDEVSGRLPLGHAVIDGATEYRFVVTAGDRSLVTVAMDRCRFP